MHVCVFVEGYPTAHDPFMTFIRPLLVEFVRLGVKCSVIAPQSVTRAFVHKVSLRPFIWRDQCGDAAGEFIEVYQPYYFSFSNRMGKLNQFSFENAARRAYKKIQNVDILYAHFWHMGIVASKVDNQLPLVIACGESKIAVRERYGEKTVNRMLERAKGIVYVSTKSHDESCILGLQGKTTPYIIEPNGYNPKVFYPVDKEAAREELGWPKDDFVISFVGAFDERKGSKRVSQAIENLHKKGFAIKSCFIGSGGERPDCEGRLHTGKLAHTEIRKYLCASDAFVLPTTHEGCCNAIIEAMACGLPIVSSAQAFNDDILDQDNSIRIDSMNVCELESAIMTLMNKPEERKRMGASSLEKARRLTIEDRANRIIAFLRDVGENTSENER